ncbi:hypothetical protein [Nocardia callitridis]|uniref:Uncharacterized protein n=1 Tax=Nocardia callitridis TaxID=648753 RepID=A0ABP9KE73_9NOCA
MPVPPAGNSTGLRLARIAALVVGSLVFLHACERSANLLPTDVLIEVAIAGVFVVAGLVAAWFEVARRDPAHDAVEVPEPTRASARTKHAGARSGTRNTRARGESDQDAAAKARGGVADDQEIHPPRASQSGEFRVAFEGCTVRAKFVSSGALVFHGRDRGGEYLREWKWSFAVDTFPAIRGALGDEGATDLLGLLEAVVPHLDRVSRRDPGAWLRAHGIAGSYREKDVDPEQDTGEIPLLRTGLPRAVSRSTPRAEESTTRRRRGHTAARRRADDPASRPNESVAPPHAPTPARGRSAIPTRAGSRRRRQGSDELPWQPGELAPTSEQRPPRRRRSIADDEVSAQAEPAWIPQPPAPSAYPQERADPPSTQPWAGPHDSGEVPQQSTTRSRRLRYDRPSWERDESTPPSSEFSAVSARSRRLRHDQPSWERELSMPPGSSEFPAVRYDPQAWQNSASGVEDEGYSDRPPLERRTRTGRRQAPPNDPPPTAHWNR